MRAFTVIVVGGLVGWCAPSALAGETCSGDLTGDGIVNLADVSIVLGAWGPNPGSPADFTGDGVVDLADLSQVLGAWGPCNNLCTSAQSISDGDIPFDNTSAGTNGSPDDGPCGLSQVYKDVWFDYVATCTGTLELTTCDQADFDTQIVLYDACNCEDLTVLGCNNDDDGCDSGTNSTVFQEVTLGQCYKIRVGSHQPLASGPGTLSVTCQEQGACPGDGDCCAANGTPGCEDSDCCSMVCGADPFCCNTAWDGICVDLAGDLCGCSGSDCCFNNGSPGCDDSECETEVCLQDPFCCDTLWDELCSETAVEECTVCQPQ